MSTHDYQPGDRVVLEHTNDPHTQLRPGDLGTVRRIGPGPDTIHIDWDSGSRLAILLDQGDAIGPLNPAPEDPTAPTPAAQTPPDPPALVPPAPTPPAGEGADAGPWEQTLDAVRVLAAAAGRDAADWWAKDAIADLAAPDQAALTALAERVLTGLTGLTGQTGQTGKDPAVLAMLPLWPPTGPDTHPEPPGLSGPAWWAQVAPPDAPDWDTLSTARRDEAVRACAKAYNDAVTTRAAAHARVATSPHGADPHLSQLDPGDLTVGSVAVFAGAWNSYTADGSQAPRYTVGYLGTLVDRWNGWAVFTCTRQVAEAIVATQGLMRAQYLSDLITEGVPAPEARRTVDQSVAIMAFDADAITVDESAVHDDDPEMVFRIKAEPDGRWVVMGADWTWEAIDPASCDHVVGQAPALGARQEYQLLRHVPWVCVSPLPLRVRPVSTRSGPDLVPIGLGVLEFEGHPVGEVWDKTTIGGRFGWSFDAEGTRFSDADFALYTAACWWRGQRVSPEQAMGFLLTEAQVAASLEQASGVGGTLARLLDEQGQIVATEPVWPAPRTHTAHRVVGRQVAERHREDREDRGVFWEIWTGRTWRYAAPADPPDTAHTATAPAGAPHIAVTPRPAYPLVEGLDRDALVEVAATYGCLLTPELTEPQMRDRLRDASGYHRPGIPPIDQTATEPNNPDGDSR